MFLGYKWGIVMGQNGRFSPFLCIFGDFLPFFVGFFPGELGDKCGRGSKRGR